MKPDRLLSSVGNYVPRPLKKFIAEEIIAGHSNKNKIKDMKQAVEKNRTIIPTQIDIELTNHCNAKCIFCPQPTQMKRSKGVMSDEVFEMILNNIETYSIRRVMLGGTGEPFLDNKIVDRIRKLKKRGVHVAVTTNGGVLDKFSPEQIVESGLDEIQISMDAVNDDYLHQIKPGIKKPLNEIEQVIGEIYKHKIKTGSNIPFILLRYQILEKSNNITDKEKEKSMILSKVKTICDEIMLRKQHDWAGSMKELAHSNRSSPTEKSVCNFLCCNIRVNWSGEVPFCCMDYDKKIVLGNILQNDIVEIFNSKKINKAREMFLNGTISKHPLCSGCYKE